MANVLFYLDQFPAFGGIETVTATLVSELMRCGHTVSIVSHIQKSNPALEQKIAEIDIFKFPAEKQSCPENRSFLAGLIDEKQIDIVVFQDDYSKMEKNLLAVFGRAKLIVCEHNSPYIPMPFKADESARGLDKLRWVYVLIKVGAWSLKRHRFLYTISDVYVLLSTRMIGAFKGTTQLDDYRKLQVIPNLSQQIPFQDKLENGEKKMKQVLFVGSLISVKGCDVLLKLWEALSVDFPEWELVIVGGGDRERSLKEYVVEKEMKNIRFEGFQTDPSRFYREASILASPTRREGLPMVLIEAMSHGCVPVCYDSFSAVRDIIDDGVNGTLVPAFDERKFSDSLRKLMIDHQMLASYGIEAQQASQRFSVEQVLPQWEALIESLMSESGE